MQKIAYVKIVLMNVFISIVKKRKQQLNWAQYLKIKEYLCVWFSINKINLYWGEIKNKYILL